MPDEAAIALELAALSVAEIVDAAGARGASVAVRRVARALASIPSRRLGRRLARFDADIAAHGLGAAARSVLRAFGAELVVTGRIPASGGVLVITNHPGAYDSLAMMAALGRDDVALVAADRAFLRAMPHVSEHLLFVTDSGGSGSTLGRAAGLRAALAWLGRGRVLVQYGAGAIEPDLRFARAGDEVLGAWSDGTGLLVAQALKQGAFVVPAFVSGVHSPRVKSLPLVRWAERRGITTVALLLQATLPGFRDVEIRVRIGGALDGDARAALAAETTHAGRTARMRAAVASLAPRAAGGRS